MRWLIDSFLLNPIVRHWRTQGGFQVSQTAKARSGHRVQSLPGRDKIRRRSLMRCEAFCPGLGRRTQAIHSQPRWQMGSAFRIGLHSLFLNTGDCLVPLRIHLSVMSDGYGIVAEQSHATIGVLG